MQLFRSNLTAGDLDQSEVDFFGTHGYLVCNNLLTADEIEQVAKECDTLVAPSDGDQVLRYFEPSALDPSRQLLRRIERFVEEAPVIGQLLASDRIQGRVSGLMKRPARLFKDKLNLKLPGGRGFRPHCDGHFVYRDRQGNARKGWKEYGASFMSVLISIDKATVENGCLELVPMEEAGRIIGRSFDEILKHTEGERHEIAEQYVAMLDFKPVPMDPGDVVFFDWRIPHRSQPNRSTMSRRILFITYGDASEGDRRTVYYADKAESLGSAREKAGR